VRYDHVATVEFGYASQRIGRADPDLENIRSNDVRSAALRLNDERRPMWGDLRAPFVFILPFRLESPRPPSPPDLPIPTYRAGSNG
jgi:hypothetical protein